MILAIADLFRNKLHVGQGRGVTWSGLCGEQCRSPGKDRALIIVSKICEVWSGADCLQSLRIDRRWGSGEDSWGAPLLLHSNVQPYQYIEAFHWLSMLYLACHIR